MTLTKQSFIALATSTMLALGTCSLQAAERHVAITQIVEHPALDAVRKGVKDELADKGYNVDKNLKWSYESAQGSPATAAQIAKKFAGESPDVIVAIATPSAQAAAASARGIPLVFTAVTDPVGAKLVKALDKPSRFITGMTDMSPINKHMELVQTVVPGAKRVGVIYNPGEANSVTLVALVNQEAPKLGMSVVEAAATKSSDVQTAARSLVGKVDAIYLPTDNTVISALEAIIKVAEQNKIPVITGDTDSVARGAIAAQGFNYYEVGRQTGAMVARILDGDSPASIPVQGVERVELFVNPGAAQRMGVTLNSNLVDNAKTVIQ
ncbi:ABC transporter substrate-binding protein [Aestuariirhabdus sp. Z084]|uniref:ABC transporter substrate-binding protein n=1 Tax=Aestuariirhabdus haliotis TaxID=2918751 RepID=UPI00201B456F|nr:ABC transporter substrate-binding protein [Aestuariirhabdus haliotis]MCL6416863.1 ABC transporter substrate-binding protein [Aestuariirhabdus haliotis]MCL6420861.1 ABC transporter substrate-binding protein [Aestuariirhabdus haliotis]